MSRILTDDQYNIILSLVSTMVFDTHIDTDLTTNEAIKTILDSCKQTQTSYNLIDMAGRFQVNFKEYDIVKQIKLYSTLKRFKANEVKLLKSSTLVEEIDITPYLTTL